MTLDMHLALYTALWSDSVIFGAVIAGSTQTILKDISHLEQLP